MSHRHRTGIKALVLEAFDKLFNSGTIRRRSGIWSPNYIQHSAHIAPAGRPF